jgi:hypothetical protein
MGYKIYEPNAEVGSTTLLGGRLDITPRDGYFDYGSDKKELLYGEYNSDATLYYGETGAVKALTGNGFLFQCVECERRFGARSRAERKRRGSTHQKRRNLSP